MSDTIFKRIRNVFVPEKRSVTVAPTDSIGLQYSTDTSPLAISSALQLSAVYRCVEVISDAIASQTWEVLEYSDEVGWSSDPFNSISYMLNNEPSINMSRHTMMKVLISKALLEGAGYVIIYRDGVGNPISLELVNETVKTFQRSDSTLYYEVGNAGKTRRIEAEDMIVILNFSYDGLTGVSTIRHAALSMGLATASESTAKGFFSSGANMSGILTTSTGKLTPDKAKAIKDSWAAAFDNTSGTPGGIAVVEGGVEFKPVTMNMADAQLLQTRQFNVVEICRFFGVSPSKVFDSANLTYSNIESFQLGFVTDTIAPWDSKIEAEFNRKLLRPSMRLKTKLNLNINDLLRGNMDSTANYYTKMFAIGAYSPNRIRTKIGEPKTEGGDRAFIPMNLIALDAPITKNTKVDKQITVQEENGKGN